MILDSSFKYAIPTARVRDRGVVLSIQCACFVDSSVCTASLIHDRAGFGDKSDGLCQCELSARTAESGACMTALVLLDHDVTAARSTPRLRGAESDEVRYKLRRNKLFCMGAPACVTVCLDERSGGRGIDRFHAPISVLGDFARLAHCATTPVEALEGPKPMDCVAADWALILHVRSDSLSNIQ